jgi:ketosteroid isomerase-like protein
MGLIVTADAQTETGLLELLERFCCRFAARDADGVMELFARDADVVMITSEEALLRGPDEVSAFLRRYMQGPTTYSWTWDRCGVSAAGTVGWLLAEGTENVAHGDREEKHPYRMSMVCEKRDGRWLLLQVHGSSPHQG